MKSEFYSVLVLFILPFETYGGIYVHSQSFWRYLWRKSIKKCFYHQETGYCQDPLEQGPCPPGEWMMMGDEPGVVTCLNNALNKTFMESDGIGQLSRFHCIINYGTQIMSLKQSQSATNFP